MLSEKAEKEGWKEREREGVRRSCNLSVWLVFFLEAEEQREEDIAAAVVKERED